MKKNIFLLTFIVTFILTFFFPMSYTSAQTQNSFLPELKLNDKQKQAESLSFSEIALVLFPFNPILMIDNDKFYAGITKEISLGFIPYGRISAEYSLVFRETHLNQLRFSYNYDFLLEAGDFAAFLLTAGGGYFTDFDKTGYFPQASLAILFPITDDIATNPYIKFRYAFVNDNKGDVYDLSFGLGLYFSP